MHSKKAYTPFDYATFADDLVRVQQPEGAPVVRLRWQRDFYLDPEPDNHNTKEQAGE